MFLEASEAREDSVRDPRMPSQRRVMVAETVSETECISVSVTGSHGSCCPPAPTGNPNMKCFTKIFIFGAEPTVISFSLLLSPLFLNKQILRPAQNLSNVKVLSDVATFL